jgi:hypothetical protein
MFRSSHPKVKTKASTPGSWKRTAPPLAPTADFIRLHRPVSANGGKRCHGRECRDHADEHRKDASGEWSAGPGGKTKDKTGRLQGRTMGSPPPQEAIAKRIIFGPLRQTNALFCIDRD